MTYETTTHSPAGTRKDPAPSPRPPEGSLEALDYGRYTEAIAQVEPSRKTLTQQSASNLLRYAEVALYLNFRDEARAALEAFGPDLDEQLAESGPAGTMARRAQMIGAELVLADGDEDRARALAEAALDGSRASDDVTARMRARLALGRIALAHNDAVAALDNLADAARLAVRAQNPFYEGLTALGRATALATLGDHVAADSRYRQSVRLLAASEDLRYRAMAQKAYADYLSSKGRGEDALVLLERAEKTAVSLGLFSDARAALVSTINALMVLGRFEDAIKRLEHLLGLPREATTPTAELNALDLLVRCHMALDNLDAAERAAERMKRIADESGSTEFATDARLMSARVRVAIEGSESVDEMRVLLKEMDETGTAAQRVSSRLYLAEALLAAEPAEAERLLEEAAGFPAVATSVVLRAELDRINAARRACPVRISPEGALVIDPGLGWPKLKDARNALERFLVNRALEQTNGNAAAAGRLLGETRYQMHYLRRIFERGEGRPSRAMTREEEEEMEFDDVEQELAEKATKPRGTRPKRLVRRR